MTKPLALTALSLALLGTASHTGHALTVVTRVTPESLKDLQVSITVTTRGEGASKQFGVAVSGKATRLSPILTARLHLMQGETELAVVPVEERWAGTKVTYWFPVAPSLLADSKFEWNEHFGRADTDVAGKPVLDPYGRPTYTPFPGTRGYWFYLRDFVKP